MRVSETLERCHLSRAVHKAGKGWAAVTPDRGFIFEFKESSSLLRC